MSRYASDETKAEAARLARENVPLGKIAEQLGFSRRSVRIWLSPISRAKELKRQREYKQDNKEKEAARKRRAGIENRKVCPMCEERKLGRHSEAPMCRWCRKDFETFKNELLTTWWNEGMPIEELAEKLDMTEASVYTAVLRARKYGFKLKRRNVRRPRVPTT